MIMMSNKMDEIESIRLCSGDNEEVVPSGGVKLPILQYKMHILHMLEKYTVLMIQGETGSGKSTRKVY